MIWSSTIYNLKNSINFLFFFPGSEFADYEEAPLEDLPTLSEIFRTDSLSMTTDDPCQDPSIPGFGEHGSSSNNELELFTEPSRFSWLEEDNTTEINRLMDLYHKYGSIDESRVDLNDETRPAKSASRISSGHSGSDSIINPSFTMAVLKDPLEQGDFGNGSSSIELRRAYSEDVTPHSLAQPPPHLKSLTDSSSSSVITAIRVAAPETSNPISSAEETSLLLIDEPPPPVPKRSPARRKAPICLTYLPRAAIDRAPVQIPKTRVGNCFHGVWNIVDFGPIPKVPD